MTKLTSFAEVIEQLQPLNDHQWRAPVPDNWKQGRTAYGGFSSAISYICACNSVAGGAPPLRSAQIAFVGPLSGEITIATELLRRGKNTAFVEAKIHSEAGLGFIANFIFMNPRDSSIALHDIAAPDADPPPADDQIRQGPPEFFTSNLDYPEKRLELGQNKPVLAGWHRITDRNAMDGVSELLCIGDALPPSAMGLMKTPGMVSSMNWQVNLLSDSPHSENGWWYLRSETHHAENGGSSQYMTAYNSKLQPMMTGMQSVALFV